MRCACLDGAAGKVRWMDRFALAARATLLAASLTLSAACGAESQAARTPAPAGSDGLLVTYVCNDGFMLSIAGKKILVDALFDDERDICRTLPDAAAPDSGVDLGGADLVLVSHSHWDHFDPLVVGDYLLANTRTLLVAERSAAEELAARFDAYERVRDRVRVVDPADGEATRITLDGIELTAVSAPADVPNAAFLIRVGGATLFHTGDVNLEAAPRIGDYRLGQEGIDVAFVPYWYLLDDKGRSLLDGLIGAADYVPMHYAGENLNGVFAAVRRRYPGAVLFTAAARTWTRSIDTASVAPRTSP